MSGGLRGSRRGKQPAESPDTPPPPSPSRPDRGSPLRTQPGHVSSRHLGPGRPSLSCAHTGMPLDAPPALPTRPLRHLARTRTHMVRGSRETPDVHGSPYSPGGWWRSRTVHGPHEPRSHSPPSLGDGVVNERRHLAPHRHLDGLWDQVWWRPIGRPQSLLVAPATGPPDEETHTEGYRSRKGARPARCPTTGPALPSPPLPSGIRGGE